MVLPQSGWWTHTVRARTQIPPWTFPKQSQNLRMRRGELLLLICSCPCCWRRCTWSRYLKTFRLPSWPGTFANWRFLVPDKHYLAYLYCTSLCLRCCKQHFSVQWLNFVTSSEGWSQQTFWVKILMLLWRASVLLVCSCANPSRLIRETCFAWFNRFWRQVCKNWLFRTMYILNNPCHINGLRTFIHTPSHVGENT